MPLAYHQDNKREPGQQDDNDEGTTMKRARTMRQRWWGDNDEEGWDDKTMKRAARRSCCCNLNAHHLRPPPYWTTHSSLLHTIHLKWTISMPKMWMILSWLVNMQAKSSNIWRKLRWVGRPSPYLLSWSHNILANNNVQPYVHGQPKGTHLVNAWHPNWLACPSSHLLLHDTRNTFPSSEHCQLLPLCLELNSW